MMFGDLGNRGMCKAKISLLNWSAIPHAVPQSPNRVGCVSCEEIGRESNHSTHSAGDDKVKFYHVTNRCK